MLSLPHPSHPPHTLTLGLTYPGVYSQCNFQLPLPHTHTPTHKHRHTHTHTHTHTHKHTHTHTHAHTHTHRHSLSLSLSRCLSSLLQGPPMPASVIRSRERS